MEQYKKGVTVIVCCYNSAPRLPETIKHLALQKVPIGFKWEVIVANNNSSDNTVEVAKTEWLKYPQCEADFKIIDEPKPGLSYAREAGINASAFEYLVFCDDDNWLDENYVEKGFLIFEKHADVGIIGGIGYPISEIEAPEWVDRLKLWHATGPQFDEEGDITEKKGAVYGAGMFMRKEAFLKMKKNGFSSIASDRKGKSLASGGDTEYCFVMRLIGYKIHFSKQLVFKHYFPKNRLNWNYNKQLFKASGLSYAQIIIYVFLYEQNKKTWTKWKLFLMSNLFNALKEQYKSLKRLLVFMFWDIEGEEYILNYSFRRGFINGLFLNLFDSDFTKIKSILTQNEHAAIKK
ncbi:MAG: glycosyltransferase [Bacteroidales bacterium]|nr:glycosyltransferase [Bacteroidales bacterium]